MYQILCVNMSKMLKIPLHFWTELLLEFVKARASNNLFKDRTIWSMATLELFFIAKHHYWAIRDEAPTASIFAGKTVNRNIIYIKEKIYIYTYVLL